MASGLPRERAGLVDRAEWGDVVHDVGATTEGADGQAAADDFAEAVVRSGVIPSSSCTPPRARRKPVMTSSKMEDGAVLGA